MEFCSERELQNQTGHSVTDWPLVVIKECIDNSLDACEEAEVAPDITVVVEPNTIVVQDNANGIAADTIESVLDYTIRVSSREAYVSPTRGAQGNALKTILAMSYVLGRKSGGGGGDAAGVTVIESRGVAHRIEFRVDHVINQPRIVHTTAASSIEVGTKITVYWPPSKMLEWAEDRSSSSSFVPMSGSILTFRCAGFGSVASSSTRKRPIRIGKSGGLVTRRAPFGTMKPDCSAISPPMWRGTATSGMALLWQRRGFIGEARGLLQDRASAQDPERGRLLAPIARALLRRRSSQSGRRRQALGGDEEIQQAGRSQASWRHRRRASQAAVPRGGRQYDVAIQIPMPPGL